MKKRLLFIYPLTYRPDKDNVAKFFALLSQWYEGHIFAMSGEKRRGLPVGDFKFHSEPQQGNILSKIYWWFRFQVLFPLSLLWGKEQISAVITYDPFKSGLAGWILKVFLRCKLIVQFNGEYHIGDPGDPPPHWLKQMIMDNVLKFVLRRADAIKVLNADQEQFCRRIAQNTPIYRFPSFVATDYYQSLETKQGNYILSVGYPFQRKGMDVLIAAFLQIAEKYPQSELRIMGHCSPEEKVRFSALAKDHPRIHFIKPGWIEDVGEQMRGCFVYVNAARSEAMGRAHIEAMACAKPIIATRTNGAQMCVVDEETGLICNIDDANDLALRLDRLYSDPSLALTLGLSGKVRMHKVFSGAAVAETYRQMFEQVMTGNSTVTTPLRGS